MPNPVSEYVAWSDNANDYADDQRKSLEQSALEDIDELMNNVEERDPELWGSLEIDDDVLVSDFDDDPIDQRGFDWVAGLSAVAAAAGLQFFLDNRDKMLINPSAYRAQVLDPFDLSRSQLVNAGKRTFLPRVKIAEYQTLQAKYIKEFSFLKDANSSVLFQELQSINGLQSFDKLAADSAGYVSRMTNYPPGSPQFKEGVADLVNMQSRGAQQGMNRRSVEALSVERQTGGDDNLPMVWILDPTSSHCTYCPERAGIVLTYREWQEYGLPGAGVCRGGDKCNCHLAVA